jgi:hypothetical protein
VTRRLRHAYIILAHKAPQQVVRLVERLDAEGVEFLVHVDRRSPASVHRGVAELGSRANVTLLPPRPTPWAGRCLMEATLAALDAARRGDPDYVSLLTGQDYPVKTPREIERTLHEAGGASFLDHFPLPRRPGTRYRGAVDPSGWADGGMPRIHSWSFQWRGREFRVPNRLVPLPIRRRLPPGVRFHGGCAYWTLSRAAVGELARAVDRRPDLVRFFGHVSLPDEIFVQTLLADAPGAGPLVNDALRYIDWSGQVSHPRVLGAEDLPRLAATEALFARKFDAERDPAVLDLIDRELLGR